MKDVYYTEGMECVAYLLPAREDNLWLLTGIRTTPKHRGRGHASKLIREILTDADAEGVRVYLSAQAETWDNQKFPGLSQTALMAWYQRLGFSSFVPLDETQMKR
jgi:ribosomal protein S18 acetylase RimI-like enzyme